MCGSFRYLLVEARYVLSRYGRLGPDRGDLGPHTVARKQGRRRIGAGRPPSGTVGTRVRRPRGCDAARAPLCSGLARRPLKAVARVRIPSGLPRPRHSGDEVFSFPALTALEGVLRMLCADGGTPLMSNPDTNAERSGSNGNHD